MKLFLISDIHGSESALKQALTCFEHERAERLLILGDVMYHGPRNPLPENYNPAGVATLLNQYRTQILAVRGNCDSEVDQMLIDYPMMETFTVLSFLERNVFLTHGHHHNPENLPALNSGDIFAFGHIHVPVAETRQGQYILNPGSIALPKEGNPPSYGIIDREGLYVKSLDGQVIKECRFIPSPC